MSRLDTFPLQILTYNIHKGFSPGKLRFMLPKMRTALEATAADIILLQEVQGEHKKQKKRIQAWPSTSQFEFLSEELWPHYAYGKNAIYQAGHHGNAILSKFPFITWENINVALMTRASRSLLHGVIKITETAPPIHIICIHLGLFKTERTEQVNMLIQRVSEQVPIQEPLIIAGDFNDWRKEATEELEKTLNLHEVFKKLNGDYAKTFPALRPTLHTDRIYFRGLELISGECLNEKPWRSMSDHLPLLAHFSINAA